MLQDGLTADEKATKEPEESERMQVVSLPFVTQLNILYYVVANPALVLIEGYIMEMLTVECLLSFC